MRRPSVIVVGCLQESEDRTGETEKTTGRDDEVAGGALGRGGHAARGSAGGGADANASSRAGPNGCAGSDSGAGASAAANGGGGAAARSASDGTAANSDPGRATSGSSTTTGRGKLRSLVGRCESATVLVKICSITKCGYQRRHELACDWLSYSPTFVGA